MTKGTFEKTYINFAGLVKDLEAAGIPGYQILDVEGLAAKGAADDRRIYYVSGNRIVIPPIWDIVGEKPYNLATLRFGINLNQEGSDDDYWFNYNMGAAYINEYDLEIEKVIFHKLTVRNYADSEAGLIRLLIYQDPFWIQQINKLLKDMAS